MVSMETTRFLPYAPGQILLLPPDLRDWLEEGHLAYFILDVVEEMTYRRNCASASGAWRRSGKRWRRWRLKLRLRRRSFVRRRKPRRKRKVRRSLPLSLLMM